MYLPKHVIYKWVTLVEVEINKKAQKYLHKHQVLKFSKIHRQKHGLMSLQLTVRQLEYSESKIAKIYQNRTCSENTLRKTKQIIIFN